MHLRSVGHHSRGRWLKENVSNSPHVVFQVYVLPALIRVYSCCCFCQSFVFLEQLSQGEEATPIFTPEDGYNWQIAKACFESADFM